MVDISNSVHEALKETTNTPSNTVRSLIMKTIANAMNSLNINIDNAFLGIYFVHLLINIIILLSIFVSFSH